MAASFDRYIAVDWSATARPKRGADSIWIADSSAGTTTLSNPATRHSAERYLCDRLIGSADERILVGFDACLGYPAGTAALFGLTGTPWRAMWECIADWSVDDDRNRNNRFDVAARFNDRWPNGAGPFWGAPDQTRAPTLMRTKPVAEHERGHHPERPAEFRATEQRLRRDGRYPKSVWQLLGAGSVGSQTLTLIPVIERLRKIVGGRCLVWPMNTGFEMPDRRAAIVFAEVWPSAFVDAPAAAAKHGVKDAGQVAAVVAAMHVADLDGTLSAWFDPRGTASERSAAVREEGWVLGPPEELSADLPGAV